MKTTRRTFLKGIGSFVGVAVVAPGLLVPQSYLAPTEAELEALIPRRKWWQLGGYQEDWSDYLQALINRAAELRVPLDLSRVQGGPADGIWKLSRIIILPKYTRLSDGYFKAIQPLDHMFEAYPFATVQDIVLSDVTIDGGQFVGTAVSAA